MNGFGEQQYKYDAFISYRHTEPDRTIAVKLQEMLEKYKAPKEIAARIGEKKLHFFRDEDELPTSSNLSAGIDEALVQSRYLICICSPAYLESRWCMQEINQFKAMHGGSNANIIPLVVVAGDDPTLVFPEQLTHETRYFTDAAGVQRFHEVEIEPLAGNVAAPTVKESLKKLKTEALRIAAPLLGVGFNDLYDRDTRRAVRRRRTITITAFAAMALFLAYSSVMLIRIASQNKDLQRQNAEIRLNQAKTSLESGDDLTAARMASGAVKAYEAAQIEVSPEADKVFADATLLYGGVSGDSVLRMSVETQAKPEFVAFSEDASALYAHDVIGNIYVFDTSGLKCLYTERLQEKLIDRFSEKGIVYTLTDTSVRAFSIDQQKVLWEENVLADLAHGYEYMLTHRDGELLALVSREEVVVLDKKTGGKDTRYSVSFDGRVLPERNLSAMGMNGEIFMLEQGENNVFCILPGGQAFSDNLRLTEGVYLLGVAAEHAPGEKYRPGLIINYFTKNTSQGAITRACKVERYDLLDDRDFYHSRGHEYILNKEDCTYCAIVVEHPDDESIVAGQATTTIKLVMDEYVYLLDYESMSEQSISVLPSASKGIVDGTVSSMKEYAGKNDLTFLWGEFGMRIAGPRDGIASFQEERLSESGSVAHIAAASQELFAVARDNAAKIDIIQTVDMDDRLVTALQMKATSSPDQRRTGYGLVSDGERYVAKYDVLPQHLYLGVYDLEGDVAYTPFSVPGVTGVDDLEAFTVTSEGQLLCAAGTRVVLCEADGTETASLTTTPVQEGSYVTGKKHNFNGCDSVAFADGRVYTAYDGEIYESDLGFMLTRFHNPAPGVFAAVLSDGESETVAFDNGTGEINCVRDKNDELWLTTAGDAGMQITDAQISADGSLLVFAAASKGCIYVYETDKNTLQTIAFPKNAGVPVSGAISDDMSAYAGISRTGELVVYDLSGMKVSFIADTACLVDDSYLYDGRNAIAFAPDGDLVIIHSGGISIYDTTRGDIRLSVANGIGYLYGGNRFLTVNRIGFEYLLSSWEYKSSAEVRKSAAAVLKKLEDGKN